MDLFEKWLKPSMLHPCGKSHGIYSASPAWFADPVSSAAGAAVPRQMLAATLLTAVGAHPYRAPNAAEAPRLFSAGPGGLHSLPPIRALDVIGGRLAAPYDVGAVAVSDAALLLHPAALVCCEAADDTLSASASRWSAVRLRFALAAAGLPADAISSASSPNRLLPLDSLASAAAGAAALPRPIARAWVDAGWCADSGSHRPCGTVDHPLAGPDWHAQCSFVSLLSRATSVG